MKKTTYMIIGLLALTLIVETIVLLYLLRDPIPYSQYAEEMGFGTAQYEVEPSYYASTDTVIVDGDGESAEITIKMKVTRDSAITNDVLRDIYNDKTVIISSTKNYYEIRPE